ncbi:hypothetical protein OEZ85_003363 [Tetradesmus obliquus]|uniref:Uncharacterized protein n=1 Tax=Tetradesmus obliquus TaxID=3088 RepID=A0ABY8UB23_TETOB|nr:hypothetical protein OEZ85_003363 [Tetradesmus obliquus]
MVEWATEVITWDQIREIVKIGTVESLGKLRRSEQQLKTYRAFMDKVRQDYASVADFIKISVLDSASKLNSEGKKEAVDSEHGGQQIVWHLNDFPYYFEDNVQHWLLWSSDRPLEQQLIAQQIAAKFPEQQWEHIMFVNPAALQSVLAIWHCHVLVRPKQQ